MEPKKKPNWACCRSNENADTGHYTSGMHTHAPTIKAHHHASGVGFVKDRSTTKAMARNMRNMEYYLRGVVPPPEE